MGMIGMITPESFSKLLGILGNKEKCIESDEFIYSKKPYRNFCTNARHFPFRARKKTHEQHKTKRDIDEFRSGTTNITLMDNGKNILVLYEFIDYMNSCIIRSHTYEFSLDEFI